LGQALAQAGDRDGALLALAQAEELITILAAQLEDSTLKSSFLNSPLVQTVRTAQRSVQL